MMSNLPENWYWKPFEDLLAEPLRNGIYKSKEFHGRGIRVVNMGEIFAYPRFKDYVDMKRVELNEKEFEKFILEEGDLIFARRSLTAEGAGKCSIILKLNEPITFESSIIRARLNKEIANPEFYYYLFNSPFGKWLLDTILRQVAVAGITGTDLLKLEVPVPPKNVQDKIASIGASLDNKIQLNRQINQTFEDIAQAIFKSWFVDFDPVKAKIAAKENGQDPEHAAMCAISGKTEEELDQLSTEQLKQLARTASLFPDKLIETELGSIPLGWKWQSLSKIADYLNGVASQKYPVLNDEESIPVIKIAEMRSGIDERTSRASINVDSKYIINDGDLLFSWSGSLMVLQWVGGKGLLNQHIFKVTSEKYPKWFCYHWIVHHLTSFQAIAAGKAVTMGHIKRNHLDEVYAAVPDDKSLLLYTNNILGTYLEIQLQNNLQNKTLSDIRDTLLPKLLSGEISTQQE